MNMLKLFIDILEFLLKYEINIDILPFSNFHGPYF